MGVHTYYIFVLHESKPLPDDFVSTDMVMKNEQDHVKTYTAQSPHKYTHLFVQKSLDCLQNTQSIVGYFDNKPQSLEVFDWFYLNSKSPLPSTLIE